jgi:PAS domain S-box-containing protein
MTAEPYAFPGPGSFRAAPPPQGRGPEGFPWAHLLAFFLGTALVVVVMWFHIANERRTVEENWRVRLTTIADDRARFIANWLNARRGDAEVLAALPQVRTLLAGAPAVDVQASVTAHLERVARAYGYSGVSVLDRQGRVVARAGGADLGQGGAEAAVGAARTGAFRVELTADGGERRMLHFALPIFVDPAARPTGEPRPVLGAVVLRMDPGPTLFKHLAEETVPTSTGEILLFSTAGPEPAYLSPYRHPPAGWAAVRRSLEALVAQARAAREGRESFGELPDYRAATVWAATSLIDPPGWGMVLKIDREEALAGFHQSGRLAGLAAAFLILALAAFLIGLWRQQQRAHLLRDQIRQERAIFNLKSYAEKIVASVPSGLLVLSGDLRILSANRSFLEAFFLRHDEVLGRRLDEVVRAEGLVQRLRESLHTGVMQHDMLFDLQLVGQRETRPVRITTTGIRIAEEEEARLLLIIQDLTEEERLHAARRASEQRFRDLVQGLDAIVWEADTASFRFTFVSQRAEAVLGYSVDHWLRSPEFWVERVHPDDRRQVLATCQTALAEGRDHEVEYRAVAADGRTVWLRDLVQLVRDAQGRPRQLRGITVDVTERKRAEEALRRSEDQLRQAQKMEAVGQLAGGIAHDFNNLLMVIQGDSDLILRRLPQGHQLRKNAEGIREAAQQAASLTRQLLAFSRKQVLAPRLVDLNQVVADMQKMLQRLLGETIQLVTVPHPDPGLVKADPGQLEQVIMNLAVNGRDAMPDGGRLTIETAPLTLDEAAAREHGEILPGRYVMLVVTDTGHGMDAATQARLFEPFFTTKEPGKGTGLGLSTVYGIVTQSGGHIWVQSQAGRGTAFRVCLPVAAEEEVVVAEREPEAPEEAAPAAAGMETVLLVEDAQRVREVVREILEMSGYSILEARNGPEAVEIARRHAGPIHLMVTDVVMPQMSGRELAQRLAAVRPDMKVLYMSGYTDDAIVRHGVLEAGTAFLSKPFTPDALAAKVREVLDAEPAVPAGRPGVPGTPRVEDPRPSRV